MYNIEEISIKLSAASYLRSMIKTIAINKKISIERAINYFKAILEILVKMQIDPQIASEFSLSLNSILFVDEKTSFLPKGNFQALIFI